VRRRGSFLRWGDPHTRKISPWSKKGNSSRITREGDEQLADVARSGAASTGPRGTARSSRALSLSHPDTPEGKSYPYLVLPHGGPEANDLPLFRHLGALHLGLGYVVMQPQYRGSTGYGSEFLNAIYQHFGDRHLRTWTAATDMRSPRLGRSQRLQSSAGAPGAS